MIINIGKYFNFDTSQLRLVRNLAFEVLYSDFNIKKMFKNQNKLDMKDLKNLDKIIHNILQVFNY